MIISSASRSLLLLLLLLPKSTNLAAKTPALSLQILLLSLGTLCSVQHAHHLLYSSFRGRLKRVVYRRRLECLLQPNLGAPPSITCHTYIHAALQQVVVFSKQQQQPAAPLLWSALLLLLLLGLVIGCIIHIHTYVYLYILTPSGTHVHLSTTLYTDWMFCFSGVVGNNLPTWCLDAYDT